MELKHSSLAVLHKRNEDKLAALRPVFRQCQVSGGSGGYTTAIVPSVQRDNFANQIGRGFVVIDRVG